MDGTWLLLLNGFCRSIFNHLQYIACSFCLSHIRNYGYPGPECTIFEGVWRHHVIKGDLGKYMDRANDRYCTVREKRNETSGKECGTNL